MLVGPVSRPSLLSNLAVELSAVQRRTAKRRVQVVSRRTISRPTASRIEHFNGQLRAGKPVKPTASTGAMERAMGIEPTFHSLQAVEYARFPSLFRVQLRPTSGNLKRRPAPAL